MQQTKNTGYLQIILGPMYSGKTSYLLDLQKQYSYSKMSCCVVNFAEDKRYDNEKLSTHDNRMIECYNTLNIRDLLDKKFVDSYQVFLINEGQFFKDLKDVVTDLVDNKHKIVHVCGLDGDFKRNTFGEMMDLIPYSDDIIKKKAICSICEDGTLALFSKRLIDSQEIKIIGNDIYKPVCRKCYNKTI